MTVRVWLNPTTVDLKLLGKVQRGGTGPTQDFPADNYYTEKGALILTREDRDGNGQVGLVLPGQWIAVFIIDEE